MTGPLTTSVLMHFVIRRFDSKRLSLVRSYYYLNHVTNVVGLPALDHS